MENVFIQKLKNILLFILKSAVLLFICIKLIFIFFIITMFVSSYFSCLFKMLNITASTWYPTGITTQILQIIVFYFISKQLGIIKTFDKLPYWVVIFIAFIYEIIIVFQVAVGDYRYYLNDFINHPLSYADEYIKYSLQGNGYLYTFLTYSIIRLLNKKYPKALEHIFKKK